MYEIDASDHKELQDLADYLVDLVRITTARHIQKESA